MLSEASCLQKCQRDFLCDKENLSAETTEGEVMTKACFGQRRFLGSCICCNNGRREYIYGRDQTMS
ncbi:unnamed protein product [Moneuplotes crassus]|uniref:Uncharacterized protein n=1 Tax=Euplotes crassus TaxID=5936 RepID=A0AAD2CW61_EUPCR|nr:unnamed protein product [Moneuplotes crassus]